jgi:hypothetical protein
MIGRRINAQALLDDLRAHPGVDASRPQFRPQRETYLLVRDAPACFCVEPKRSKTPFQRGYVKSQRS